MAECERCSSEALFVIMSKFNTEMLCLDCKTIEENHPDYNKAVKEEREQIKQGNYNYKGIGKPKDL